MTHATTDVCPQCGKPGQRQLAGKSCPQCLMALAMNDGSNVPTTGPNSGRPDQTHVPRIEELVNRFPDLEIQHLIGHGGMGAVYQARQINLDRVVALKILSPRLSCDPAFAERFLREARTLAKLSHPNIVTVFDFGQAGEFYYLTMEFVDGVNLRDTIAAKLLTPGEALAIVPQVCEALQYAHDHGVVHRDIKPENILIAKSGGIKIADFGLAKLLSPSSDHFTLTGTRQVLGTMNYMAPEQIESPDFVDHRADLYSLGVVFYELLTGELPLGRFSLPSEKSASISNRLDDVVMRTLEKDPNRRFQQASQIKTACESLEQPKPSSSEAPATPPVDNSDAISLCVPFPVTIQDIFAGMASGYGMLRGFDSHLELEYEIRDSVVDHKWGAGRVQLPLESITSIKLHQGWFFTYIDVQADNFDVVSEIPNSKHGAFRVSLKRKFREPASQLVWRVNEFLGFSPPMPPVKQQHFHAANSSGSRGVFTAVLVAALFGLFVFSIFAVMAVYVWLSATAPPAADATVDIPIVVSADAGAASLEPVLDPDDGTNQRKSEEPANRGPVENKSDVEADNSDPETT